MIDQCKTPGCTMVAQATWAQVPLCNGHFEMISKETDLYYSGHGIGTEAEQRPHYMDIAHRIPWSKMRIHSKGGDRR